MINMIPGMGNKLKGANLNIDEKQIDKTKAIIQSMTTAEKNDPKILNGSRRKRIASGSGTTVQEVNLLVNQYEMMKDQMRKIMGNKGALIKAARKIGKNIDPEELKKYKGTK